MRLTQFSLTILLALGLSVAANAAPLPSPGLLFPMPLEAAPSGVVLSTTTMPFVAATYSGTLTSTVLSGDATSPFPGGLTFTYVLSNLTGTSSINRLSINGFGTFSLDASSTTPAPAGTVPPAFVDREPTGTAIGFSFVSAPIGAGSLGTGQTSTTMVVQTDATSFSPSAAFVLDGFPAPVTALAPIPEPGTLALAGAGLALAGIAISRHRRSGR
jgi:PEP-CTERM motif-containing protein